MNPFKALEKALLIFLYVILFVGVCAIIGSIAARNDKANANTMNLYLITPEKGKHVATMFVPAFTRLHAIQRFTRVFPRVLIDDAEKYESPTERYLKEVVDEWDKKDAVYPKTRAETLRQKVP